MEAIQVIDSTHLVPLPSGRTIMVGAPPEALKVLTLWEFPSPNIVVLPPDPLFAHGINQASFEFLLYNHLFIHHGLRDGEPFLLVCDPEQKERVESLLRHMLRGPEDAEMMTWRTPASHRRQLIRETAFVSGEVARREIGEMARVLPFEDDCVALPDGTVLDNLPAAQEVRVTCGAESVTVPRRSQGRTPLPLYFADVEEPVVGPRFGLQVIGSASGFSAAEWSSCFIVWINGQALIIDGTPYLDDHLRRLGIEDDAILGYLITHNHEDHANLFSQLVSRRPVTVLTSGPVMSGLVSRMAAVLGSTEKDVRGLFRWVPLHPGMEGFGDPLHWFGAEIRTWYSVHTIPTLGVDVSMDGKHVRMPGDTLWGRQLEPLLDQEVISPRRYEFIQRTYDGADVIVADAGGGPIHPDPQEVGELISHHECGCMMVTHIAESARGLLPPAEPGTVVTLLPRPERTPEAAMAIFGSPLFRRVPERWLLTLLYGGEVVDPPEEPRPHGEGAVFVLSGSLSFQDGDRELYPLQRGDLFHPALTPDVENPVLKSTALWTRLLRIPDPLYQSFLKDTGIRHSLQHLYETRAWWRHVIGEELGLDTLVALSQLCRTQWYQPGADIVTQGEPAADFYVITEGEVEVLRTNGTERSIGRFGPGYHFGEIALLCRELRTATVRATRPTRVLELPGRAFIRHLMDIPVARHRVCRVAAQRRAELFRGSPEAAPTG
jgi:hypothetical protein